MLGRPFDLTGPGRPKLEREQKYRETLIESCSLNDWQRICQRAVKDAVAGDHRAREWLGKYLVGDPVSVTNILNAHVHTDNVEEGDDPYLGADSELILQAKSALARLKESCEDRNGAVVG